MGRPAERGAQSLPCGRRLGVVALLAAATVAACSATQPGAKAFAEQPWRVGAEDVARLGPATYTLDVRWVRIVSTLPEMRDGVCVVYVGDNDERALRGMGEQLSQCGAEQHPLPPMPPVGARRIAVHLMPDPRDMFAANRAFELVYGSPKPMFITRGAPHLVAPPPTPLLGGFYVDLDPRGTCVVAGFETALGHEVKHCFDGEFHDAGGAWRRRP